MYNQLVTTCYKSKAQKIGVFRIPTFAYSCPSHNGAPKFSLRDGDAGTVVGHWATEFILIYYLGFDYVYVVNGEVLITTQFHQVFDVVW